MTTPDATATPAPTSSLAELYHGFRERFLDHAELTAQLADWARAFPEVVRVSSIGQSGEGRELLLLTIGAEPDRARPSAWVDGNMHASELSGSSVALAIAEDVIRLHLEPGSLHGLPAHVCERLRGLRLYVLPRLSPDGAEAVLKQGRWVRSVPRDTGPVRDQPRWLLGDLDGDGLSLLMRKQDATGEYVESRDHPGVLLPRELEDEGPFYKLYPEGTIDHFDGRVPDPYFMSDNSPDLNRNFPYSWAPEHEQEGAGEFAASEPESRAVVEFVTAHPEIFAWLNLHTFGGVFIRPLGDQPDDKMNADDLALFHQIAEWGERHAGYPTVSGFEEFTYQPDKPLRGDLTDFAFHQRGAIAYVCELWDLFRQIKMERTERFCDQYTHVTRQDLERLAAWDRDHNASRIYRPWRAITHPQLGPVEVGGFDPRVGLWNPPPDRLPGICAGQSAAYLRVAALAPHVLITELRAEPAGAGQTHVTATIENHGYLPSYVLESAKKLAWNEPLHAEIVTHRCTLDAASEQRREIGHLHGWGRGKYNRNVGAHLPGGRGNGGTRTLRWLVHGSGTVMVRVSGRRVGSVERAVEIQ